MSEMTVGVRIHVTIRAAQTGGLTHVLPRDRISPSSDRTQGQIA